MALPQNPHDANPPDYRAERYAPTRQPLVEHCNITHEVAAQRLLEIWTAQNALERREWDARQEAEAEQARLEEDNLLERQREEELIRAQEEEALQQEEKKKNRTKFLPFNDVKVSSAVPVNPSPHALRKLRKGEYLELHHFTNKGLAEAHSISHSVDDDALALMQDEHGTHSFVPISAAKAKETIVPDHELTWPQIDEATHRMLLAMKECGWGADRIDAHLHFWMNLSAHEWRHDAEDAARQALIVYQATYRRRWHAALGTSSSFNLKYIDEEALIKIKFNITSKLHTAITIKAKEASTFPFSEKPLLISTPTFLSYPTITISIHLAARPTRMPLEPDPLHGPRGTWHGFHNTATIWTHSSNTAQMRLRLARKMCPSTHHLRSHALRDYAIPGNGQAPSSRRINAVGERSLQSFLIQPVPLLVPELPTSVRRTAIP